MTFHQYPSTYPKHVQLLVTDLPKAMNFYKDILGLRIMSHSSSVVVFTVNGHDAILTIEASKDFTNQLPNRAGLYHMAFLVPSKEQLGAIFNHIQKSGYSFSGASDHLVSEALYLNDIDGNGIEIYYDRSPEKWNWTNGEVEMTVDQLDVEGLIASGQATTWHGMPDETVMGHIHLRVANLKEAETFYIKGLGFNVVSRFGNQALFISTNGYHHHIALNSWGNPSEFNGNTPTLGLKSFSLVYPNEVARQNVVQQLKEIGITTFKQDDYVVAVDPSGIEVQMSLSLNN